MAATDRIRPAPTDVLLVIDVQNDFCPGGKLAIREGDAVVPVINRLARRFEHVVLTQDWHPSDHLSFASQHAGKAPFDHVAMPYGDQVLWPDHCVQGMPGAEFRPDLDIPHAELVLRKGFRRGIDSYSGFYENDKTTATGLRGYLEERGFNRVVLVGLALDYCVRFSAEDAARAGFAAVVVEDACRPVDAPGTVEAAYEGLRAAGVTLARSDAFMAAAA